MSETSVTGSAAEQRRVRGAALVAQHPRWHGIRHPELIAVPPRRFSQLDMLPAIEAERLRRLERWGSREERNRQIVAAHPRWHGIRHPERLFFREPTTQGESRRAYLATLRRAQRRLDASKSLCASITAVADELDRRRWPWGASPGKLPSPVVDPVRPPRRRLQLPTGLRRHRPGRPRFQATPRLLAH